MGKEGVNYTFSTDVCPSSSCFALSPLSYWGDSFDNYVHDDDPWERISSSQYLSSSNLKKISRDALFSHLTVDSDTQDVLGADALALTYVFNVTSAQQAYSIDQWISRVSVLETDLVSSQAAVQNKVFHQNALRYQKRTGSHKAVALLSSFSRGVLTVKDLIEVSLMHLIFACLSMARSRRNPLILSGCGID